MDSVIKQIEQYKNYLIIFALDGKSALKMWLFLKIFFILKYIKIIIFIFLKLF